MTRSALFAGLGVLALASFALAGCATSSGGSPSKEPTSQQTADSDLGAAWLDGGRMIGLVTVGSSTCVPKAQSAEVTDGILHVTLAAADSDGLCTRDLVPRATLVPVPEGVDPQHNLEIQVAGDEAEGQVELEGVPGLAGGGQTDHLPSAGWATAEDQFVILSWGSSTCVPEIQDVAATGPAEVTVTYKTPAGNQTCTADMAPRAAVAGVTGLEDSADVSLILQGGEFDNVKVPIYGTN